MYSDTISLKETHRRFYIPTFHGLFNPNELYLQWEDHAYEVINVTQIYYYDRDIEQFESPLETRLGKSLYQ